MYSLYKEKREEEGKDAVSEWVYRKSFNECFNLTLRFHVVHVVLTPYTVFLPHITSTLANSFSLALTLLHISHSSLYQVFVHRHIIFLSFSSNIYLSLTPLKQHSLIHSCSHLYPTSLLHPFLLLYRRRTDTCKTCDSYKVKVEVEG